MNVKNVKAEVKAMKEEVVNGRAELAARFIKRISERKGADCSVSVYFMCVKYIKDYRAATDKRDKLEEIEKMLGELEDEEEGR